MSTSKKAAKSAIIIMIFTLGSKFLGFLREVLIAAKFGSGMETDTYFIAMSATGIITGLMSNAINTTFIPVAAEIENAEGKKGKLDHTNNLINIVFFLSLILVCIAWIASPLIIKLLAKGFYGEQYKLAIQLLRIGLPMIIFSSIIGVFLGFLQSEQRYMSTAAIGFPFNFVYIFFLLFLSSKFGIKGLMVASVIAVFSQILIQLPEAKRAGYKYKFIFNTRDKYIKKILYLSISVFIGVAINDLNAIVDRTLASSLVAGSISALNYANRLNGLILGVFITAITTVIFPLLSKEFSEDNIKGVKKIMGYGVNLILLITIPAAVGLTVLSTPIVEVAFERGEFDSVATIMTSKALIFYSIGLVAMAIRLLVTRVYFSLQDTKTPMINGAVSVVFNIVLNLILVQFMGHAGLAFATSIATTIATLLMFYDLKKKIGSLGTKSYIVTFFKSGLSSAIMGVFANIVYKVLYNVLGVSKLSNLISLILAVGTGVVVYSILCYVLNVKEMRDVIVMGKNKIARNNKTC